MAKLPSLVIDLFDKYGSCHPRPSGMVIKFSVIHENTTYHKAKAEIEALLTKHGLLADLSMDPGPEMRRNFNRRIDFTVAKDMLV